MFISSSIINEAFLLKSPALRSSLSLSEEMSEQISLKLGNLAALRRRTDLRLSTGMSSIVSNGLSSIISSLIKCFSIRISPGLFVVGDFGSFFKSNSKLSRHEPLFVSVDT